MTLYVATINTPGYLPWDDDPPVFDTASEAWQYLADRRMDGEDDIAENGYAVYSSTVWDLVNCAENGTTIGTVYGSTPGYDGDHDLGLAYSVAFNEEWITL